MEDLCLRYPHIFEMIISNLNNQTLANCRSVSNQFSVSIENGKILWIRIIQKQISRIQSKYQKLNRAWKIIIDKAPSKVIKELANELYLNSVEHSKVFLFPLHIAAASGLIDSCEYLLKNTKDENLKDYSGQLPFHLAAKNGHYDICKLMLKIKNINSSDNIGVTPLHLAAENNQIDICKLILRNLVDENPSDLKGKTALHYSAAKGHLDICRLLISVKVS